MNAIFRTAIVTASLTVAASVANADSSYLGKTNAHITQSALNVTGGYANVLSVQLPKGVKKRILEVDAQLIETTNNATAIGLMVYVNGYAMEPSTSGSAPVVDNCTASTVGCTAQGHWWADLDAYETAHPGEFIGLPLNIEMRAAKSPGAGTTTGKGTISARLMKK